MKVEVKSLCNYEIENLGLGHDRRGGDSNLNSSSRQDCCGDRDEEERDDHDGSPENDIHLPLPRPCGGRQPTFPRPI